MTTSGGSATAGDTSDVTLPVSAGSIQNVVWSATTVSGGQPITVTADLSGFDSPPTVKVKILAFLGAWPPIEVLADLAATVNADGSQASVTWTPSDQNPPAAVVPCAYVDGGPLAFGPMLSVDARWLETPFWDPPRAKVGDTVQAKVQTHGYAAGTAVSLRVLLWDNGNESNPVTTLNGTVADDGLVACSWTVPRALDASNQHDVLRAHRGDPSWGQSDPVADTPKKIQRYLRALFVRKKIDKDPGMADGHLGDRSLQAVRNFKTKYGIAPASSAITDEFRTRLAEVYNQEVQEAEQQNPSDNADLPAYFAIADAPGHSHAGYQLEVVPPYTIALEIGDPGLFMTPLVSANEDPAKAKNEERRAIKERLQAIGRYYEPLPHNQPAERDVATSRFRIASRALAREASVTLGNTQEPADNDDLVAALTTRLQKKIVVRADGTDWPDDQLDDGRPMVNAKDLKIVVPGAFTFDDDDQLGDGPGTAVTQYRFAKSKLFYERNPGLGKIPVFAAVWVRNLQPAQQGSADDVNWRPAPAGIRIVFELIRPYDDTTGDQDFEILGTGNDANGVANLHVERRSREYVKAMTVGSDFDPDDPQRVNCPMDKGGKRGRAVPGGIFALGDLGLGDRWPWVAEPGPNPNSVVVSTGDDGHAAVCFMPSTVAGDAYRIRAYLEAAGNPGDAPAPGTDKDDPDDNFSPEGQPATTGRIRIWRSLVLSRYLQVAPGSPDANYPASPVNWGTTLTTIDLVNQTADRFKRCFFHVEVEDRAKTPERLSLATRNGAHDFAVRALNAHRPAGIPNWDLSRLLTKEGATKKNFITTMDPNPYNAAIAGTAFAPVNVADPNLATYWGAVCDAYLGWFMLYLTGDGEPGLTVVQALVGDEPTHTTQADWAGVFYSNQIEQTSSGQAVRFRGAYIFYGDEVYQTWMYSRTPTAPTSAYGIGANTAHEFGHVLHMRHHWSGSNGQSDYNTYKASIPPHPGTIPTPGWNFLDDHDYLNEHCVMSYLACTGQFCGRCILNLRGWDLNQIPRNR